jgi:hypothetical protein
MTARRTLERHERTLGELRARLAEIPGPMWGWRPAPGAWSAAEVYDHIDRIARLYSFPQLEACLRGEGRRGGGRTLLGWCLLGAPWLAGVFRVRRDFPEAFVPAVLPQEEVAARLDGLLDLARGAAERVALDPGRLRVRHVSLGWLTAAQWFAFAEIHTRHHLEGQLARLQTAWERRAGAGVP